MNSRFNFIIPFLIASILFFSAATKSFAESFSRSLTIGSTGEDVVLLQQLLNQDSRTMIAESGAGSPGNETGIFGGLTKAAVIRFQELYSDEILKPAGLTRGTGFVGVGTLKKLKAVAQGVGGGSTIALTGLYPSQAAPNTFVTVQGVGFTEKSTVLFAGTPVQARLLGVNSLQFVVPPYTSGGFQKVTVRDERGNVSNVLEMMITGPAVSVDKMPVITQVNPARGGLGTTITITGSGFALTPTNTIYTGYSKIPNTASVDGKTLSFTIPSYMSQFDFSQTDFSGLDGEATLPFGIAVENTNGMSEYSLFTFVVH